MTIRSTVVWLSRLSAIGFLAITALYIRSYFVHDYVGHDSQARREHVDLTSFEGELTLTTGANIAIDDSRWVFTHRALHRPTIVNMTDDHGERHLWGVVESDAGFMGIRVWRGKVEASPGHFCTIKLRHAHVGVAFLVCSVRAFIQWFIQCRRKARFKLGRCPNCGYDLRASAGECPECGKLPQATV